MKVESAIVYGWCPQHMQSPVKIDGRRPERVCQSGVMVHVVPVNKCPKCRQMTGWIDEAWTLAATIKSMGNGRYPASASHKVVVSNGKVVTVLAGEEEEE